MSQAYTFRTPYKRRMQQGGLARPKTCTLKGAAGDFTGNIRCRWARRGMTPVSRAGGLRRQKGEARPGLNQDRKALGWTEPADRSEGWRWQACTGPVGEDRHRQAYSRVSGGRPGATKVGLVGSLATKPFRKRRKASLQGAVFRDRVLGGLGFGGRLSLG
jgi:hypothetical protein